MIAFKFVIIGTKVTCTLYFGPHELTTGTGWCTVVLSTRHVCITWGVIAAHFGSIGLSHKVQCGYQLQDCSDLQGLVLPSQRSLERHLHQLEYLEQQGKLCQYKLQRLIILCI